MLPTYNEALNIERLFADILAAVPDVTVLVVDDGSPDGTTELAEKVGLGDAYRAGFRWVRARDFDVVVQMDADLSRDPGALPALVAMVGVGAELVIGSRYAPGGSMPESTTIRGGGRVAEVPIRFIDREEGESKMNSRIVFEAYWVVTGWGGRNRLSGRLRRRRR